MINPSHYPFLNSSKISISEFNEQSIFYCKKHIEKYTPTNIQELDIPVWLISTIMLRNISSNYLTRKFVSNYGKLAEYYFTKDTSTKQIRLELLEYFNILKDIEFIQIDKKITTIRIHMNDYLELTLEVSMSPQAPFSLAANPPEKGYILIEKPRFIYLMRLVLEQKLISKIKSMKVYTENKLINEIVEELKVRYPKPKSHEEYLNLKNSGVINSNIRQLIEKIHIEHYLNHRERITLGIYLQKYNFDWEYIIDLFKELSDYDPKITEYQLKSLRRYIK